ncbi:MAG: hypothetical protein GXY03_08110 [Solirubrobacterales bacterium]|nr:hypothetical protein [Solirubrobacterales bacterium]
MPGASALPLRLLFAVALVLALAAPPATADVPRDGSGFAIADDETDWENPAAAVNLGAQFERLRPAVYRLQIPWNALEPAPLGASAGELERASNRSAWRWRTHALIDAARARGATEIVLTLRANNDSTVGRGGYVPPVAVHAAEVARVVADFAPKVDAWGVANEPNLWQVGDDAHRDIGRIPTAALVTYQDNLAAALAAHDPSALRTSPDFNDETRDWLGYVRAYSRAGGDWGDVAALHPYGAVASYAATGDPVAALRGIEDYARAVPPGLDIWATEVGAHHTGDPARQAAAVDWLATGQDGCASTAPCSPASHDRFTRILYYHVRDHSDSWDTALVESDLTPRPAWTVWCAAAHGDRPDHPDCRPTAFERAGSPVAPGWPPPAG